MKPHLFNISLFILLIACTQARKPQAPSKFDQLSRLYKDTTFGSLYIYPDTAIVDSLFAFCGNALDSTTHALLSDFITKGYPFTEGFHGVYRFKIDEEHVGLITRTPGEYAPTVVSLWVYDLQKDSLTNNVLLADLFGDAGDYQTINSYLFFDNKQQLKALTYRHYSYYHDVEDVADTKVDHTHYYALRRIRTHGVDTLSMDSLQLHKDFGPQLKRMETY